MSSIDGYNLTELIKNNPAKEKALAWGLQGYSKEEAGKGDKENMEKINSGEMTGGYGVSEEFYVDQKDLEGVTPESIRQVKFETDLSSYLDNRYKTKSQQPDDEGVKNHAESVDIVIALRSCVKLKTQEGYSILITFKNKLTDEQYNTLRNTNYINIQELLKLSDNFEEVIVDDVQYKINNVGNEFTELFDSFVSYCYQGFIRIFKNDIPYELIRVKFTTKLGYTITFLFGGKYICSMEDFFISMKREDLMSTLGLIAGKNKEFKIDKMNTSVIIKDVVKNIYKVNELCYVVLESNEIVEDVKIRMEEDVDVKYAIR